MASVSAFEMSTSLLRLSVLFFPPSFSFLCDFIGALKTDIKGDKKTGLDDRNEKLAICNFTPSADGFRDYLVRKRK